MTQNPSNVKTNGQTFIRDTELWLHDNIPHTHLPKLSSHPRDDATPTLLPTEPVRFYATNEHCSSPEVWCLDCDLSVRTQTTLALTHTATPTNPRTHTSACACARVRPSTHTHAFPPSVSLEQTHRTGTHTTYTHPNRYPTTRLLLHPQCAQRRRVVKQARRNAAQAVLIQVPARAPSPRAAPSVRARSCGAAHARACATQSGPSATPALGPAPARARAPPVANMHLHCTRCPHIAQHTTRPTPVATVNADSCQPPPHPVCLQTR